MICTILRQFFQSLLNDLQSLSLRRICLVWNYVPQNYSLILIYVYSKPQTFPREKQVCGGGLENVCESDADWGEKPPVSFSAADGRF